MNSGRVEYLLIGGVAYNYHAPPRATKDLDVWVRPVRENLVSLLLAIREFGFPTTGLSVDELATKTKVLMLGVPPNRIDILTRPTGLDWDGAWARKSAAAYDDVPVWLLDIADLIRAKRAAARPRDLADVASLEEIVRRRGAAPSTE
ncbi:MAG: hypothetical protein HYZ53_03840 [Planctomycetes bacterium]|nr:hypothetical protein [Planctomycetota bacterium]